MESMAEGHVACWTIILALCGVVTTLATKLWNVMNKSGKIERDLTEIRHMLGMKKFLLGRTRNESTDNSRD